MNRLMAHGPMTANTYNSYVWHYGLRLDTCKPLQVATSVIGKKQVLLFGLLMITTKHVNE